MAKWGRKYTYFSFAIVLALGTIAFFTFSYPSFEKVKSFQIVKINDDGTFVAKAIIEVKCDNWFSFTGENVDFNMFYKDALVSTGKITQEITFKKNTTIELPMSCNFNPAVFGDELETLLLKDTVVFLAKIKGKFTFFKLTSSKDMEVKIAMSELAGSLVSSAMSEKPIDVDSLSIESISLSHTKIANVLVFQNTMTIDYQVESIDYGVYSDENLEKSISTGHYEVNQLLKAGDSAIARGYIEMNNLKSLSSGFDKLRKRNFIYYISGLANIKVAGHHIQVPIEQKFSFNPIRKTIEIIK